MVKRIALACALLLAALPARAFDLSFSADTQSDSLRSALRTASLTVSLKSQEEPATAQDIVAAARADYTRLIAVLYDGGYFGPQISIRINGREAATLPAISPIGTVDRVDVAIIAGPRFRFGTARVSPLPGGTVLPEDFTSGRVVKLPAMRAAVDAGIAGWRAQGHAKARIANQRIVARHAEAELDADIRLDPGPRLRFGRLSVTGNSTVREGRIRQIAGLREGEVFNPDELTGAATRMRRSGVFESVAFKEADVPNPDGTLDITAQVTEAKPRRFGFGAELSSEEGIRLSGFWLHRNLRGGGERLRLDGEIRGIGGETGGEDYEVKLSYGRPATFSRDTDFFALLDIEIQEEPNFDSDRLALQTGIRVYASDNREYSYAIGYEAAEINDAFGRSTYRVFTLPLTAEFDYRDNELDATRGYYAKASATPFFALAGTDNGIATLIDTRFYRSTGPEDRVTFALRGQLGAIIGPALSDVPADYLFYSGGGGTVRGQDYQSLGVDLGGGDVSGGRSFVGLSAELRVKTGDRLSVVGFFDAGYIGDESFPDGSGEWHTGAGAGIRYDTGLGPIRLDLAVPVSGPGPESGVEIYIGIGQAF